MFDVSPAIERAALAARARAGDAMQPRLAHWLLGLLEEDEGRPAALLERLGIAVESVRVKLSELVESSSVAPDDDSLFEAAHTLSLNLRGDAAFTTEFVFLAALEADAGLAQSLAAVGVDATKLVVALRSPTMADEDVSFDGDTFTIADPPAIVEAARVVDANMNRAREAFRVLDDHARFILNDRFLTERLKNLRHRLVEAAGSLPGGLLISMRDTVGDVGTDLTATGEYERRSPATVAVVNMKRLQEALRSLEEFGKVLSGEFGKAVEKLRYESYTLERAIVRGISARERLAKSHLYVLLTSADCSAALDWTINEAAIGGVDVFQLREKNLSDRDLLDRARRMREWTRTADVLFIVNDRPDIARLVGADGVHLGQDDMPVAAARRIVGPDLLIGVSTHNIEQVRTAILDGADYLGVGPTFPSRTKSFDHFPGLYFVREAATETTLPTYALGGINATNAQQIVDAGLTRVAVAAAIGQADDPRAAAMQLRWIMTQPRLNERES